MNDENGIAIIISPTSGASPASPLPSPHATTATPTSTRPHPTALSTRDDPPRRTRPAPTAPATPRPATPRSLSLPGTTANRPTPDHCAAPGPPAHPGPPSVGLPPASPHRPVSTAAAVPFSPFPAPQNNLAKAVRTLRTLRKHGNCPFRSDLLGIDSNSLVPFRGVRGVRVQGRIITCRLGDHQRPGNPP